VKQVLFLCTGNSARSILAEVLLNDLGKRAFKAYSAGSHPAGKVNPGALEKLAAEGHRVAGLTSKSWDQFSGNDAPDIDIVITVCDNAAGESCPLWPGSPVTVHWGIPDPACFDDEAARRAAFDLAYVRLRRRVEEMLALSPSLSSSDFCNALQKIHARSSTAEHTN
jgi:arsenate reductase